MAATIAVAAVLLTTSCARPGGPGVDVKTVASDIVFNAEAPEPEAVPTLAMPPSSEGFEGFGEDDGPDIEEEAPEPTARVRPPVTVPPPPARPACPDALATAFPAEAATFDSKSPPAAGEYRWKRTITNTIPGTKNTVVQTVFNKHQITNVSNVAEAPNPQTPDNPTRTFSFDETAFFVDGSSTLTSFRVRDNAPQVQSGGATSAGGNSVDTQRKLTAGPPDRGVAITGSVRRDASGKQVGVAFKPSTPVLILPLPVAVPMEFESVGVDPTTGASLAITGEIIGKRRVDACGDIVDGWDVQSTQTFTASDGRQSISDVRYIVATQLGGIVIEQTSSVPEDVPNADERTRNTKVTDSLAQLEPTPI